MAQTPDALPLARHALFRSRDLDEARERVAAVFCPHRLQTVAERARFDACHHHLRGRMLSLNYIEYGARTLIDPGALTDFYLIQIPLQGAAEIRNGTQRYHSTPARAAVLNPHLPTRMIWAEGTRQVLVQIDRAAMQRHLAGLLGGPPDRPLTFLGPLDLESGAGAAFRRLVMWLVAEADCGACPIGPGLMGAQIEATLLAGLLEGCAHDHAGAIARVRAAPRPRHLRLAEAYVEAHLDRPLTLDEIAAAAGVSPRALQMAFRRFRGTTPLAFLRDLRLARAHAELSAGAPGTTVTGVALKWGFGHFGRFAGQYRARYGLSPSDTLKAARG